MIKFFNSEIDFSLKSKNKYTSWILSTFKSENIIKDIELSVVFCSDDALLKINQSFLGHDYYTDIITFPIEETDKVLEAELYISIDRIKDNATKEKVSFYKELNRVIIHGVLHLCGYGDKTEQQIKTMRSKEDFYLFLFLR